MAPLMTNSQIIKRGVNRSTTIALIPIHILDRAQRFLTEVRQHYPGQLTLAVTHRAVIAFTVMWTGGLASADQHRGRLVELGISDGYPFPASINSLIYTTEHPTEAPTLAYRPYAD